MITIYSRVVEWIKSPYRFIKHIGRFIYKLWYYVPVLWQDEEWDHGYLLKLLHTKLLRMERFWRYGRFYSDSGDTLKQIREAIDVLERLMHEDYCNEEYDAYWKKRAVEAKLNPDNRGKSMWEIEESEELKNEGRILRAKTYQLYESDWHKLWCLLDKNLRNWWD